MTASDTDADPGRPPSLFRLIKEDVACVKSRDPAARHTLEIVLTYPGVHAVIHYRLANRLWRKGRRFRARCLSWFARLVTNVDIHPGATIGRRFFIDHGAGVVIGETARIGDDVTMYHGVTLGGTSWSPGRRHPTIESGVLIGCGAKILGPIRVGAGARVGANSVVVEDVPPGMTVVGVPGKLVRHAPVRRPDGRIDLNHHLIPDPLGEVLDVLIDRIGFLEARVNHLQGRPPMLSLAPNPADPPRKATVHGRPNTASRSEERHAMNVLDHLSGLSSAEDFFAFLEVPFDPDIVQVSRLHILRRMGQYLKGSQIDGAFDDKSDDEIRGLCRAHLDQAYQDFVASSPIQERLFKVHKEAVAAKPEIDKPFVSLTTLTASGKAS